MRRIVARDVSGVAIPQGFATRDKAGATNPQGFFKADVSGFTIPQGFAAQDRGRATIPQGFLTTEKAGIMISWAPPGIIPPAAAFTSPTPGHSMGAPQWPTKGSGPVHRSLPNLVRPGREQR